ncbi:MAG: hypothetical protein GXY70_08500 [Euryarchaeota archaeon]|nr:hypothetical protein [Euryarchaeota archaeon]
MSLWKDKDGPVVLMVGIVLIIAVVVAVMAFAPLEDFSRENEWSYEDDDAVEGLKLVVVAEVCEVEVSFDDLDGRCVDVSLNMDGRSGYLAGYPDIRYGVSTNMDGGDLTVTVTLDMTTGPTVIYDDSNIVVTIDRSVPTYLDIDVDVGDVVVTVPGNASLKGAVIRSDVGGLQMHLEKGAMVMDDLDLVSDVGSIDLNGRSAVFGEGVVVSAETGTGSIHLDLLQSSPPDGNMTFECFADVGSVYLTLTISGNVSAEITSHAGVGEVETELLGFSGMDVHLMSDNHPDAWSIELFLEVDVGTINIDAEWNE